MPRSDLTFRVFVSSTFSDFRRERLALQRVVFPRLREYCRQCGAKMPGMEPRFQAIDLRWGVAREAALDQQTMTICLQELARCQALSPKPNFIVLVGDRYGWMPLPPRIDAVELDELLPHLSEVEQSLIVGDGAVATWRDGTVPTRRGWYRKDLNADPVEYVLQPRTIDFPPNIVDDERVRIQKEEFADWSAIERRIQQAFSTAIETAGWSVNDVRCRKYERSATHHEIEHGALSVTDADQHVFGYFRTIKGLPDDGPAAEFRDLVDKRRPDPVATGRLDGPRRELEDAIPTEHRFPYTVTWGDVRDPQRTEVVTNAENLLEPEPDLKAFCDRVESDLRQIIDQELDVFQQETSTQREARLHTEFSDQQTRHFVGRDDMLGQIKSYCAQDNSQPLVIAGVSGSGKTALLAKAAQELAEAFPTARIISRFIGATPGSTELRTLLGGLCRELGPTPQSTAELLGELHDLSREFEQRLDTAASEHPVFVLLDALDQLSASDGAHALWWLPRNLPAGARIVVTVLDREDASGECHRAAQRLFRDQVVRLDGLSVPEGEKLLDAWLSDARRTLQPAQRQTVLGGFQHSLYPLYLRTTFHEVRRWKSWDEPPPLGPDVPALLKNLFHRLSQPQQHGPQMVRWSLGYLAAARRGLTEDELLDVLSRDEQVLEEFRSRSPDSPETDRLPVVVWSRLFADLQENLTQRQNYGTAVLSFYHRQVQETVENEFLTDVEWLRAHQHLANYFRSDESVPRNLDEFPWHLVAVEDWRTLHGFLARPHTLCAIWNLNEWDARNYWTQIERNSTLRASTTYRQLLLSPATDPDSAWLVGVLLLNHGHTELATSFWESLANHFEKSAQTANHAGALVNGAECSRTRGRISEAIGALQKALVILRRTNDWRGVTSCLLGLANLHLDRRELPEALNIFRKVERLASRIRDRLALSASLGGQARVLFWKGDHVKARTLLTAEESICAELGEPSRLSRCWLAQAELFRRAGTIVEAQKVQQKAEDNCRKIGDKSGEAAAIGARAVTLEQFGECDAALRLLQLQEWICKGIGDEAGLATCYGNQGKVLLSLMERDGKHRAVDAIRLLKERERIGRRSDYPTALLASLQNQAIALRALGKFDMAFAILDEKEGLSRELDDKPALATCLQEKANLLLRNQDQESSFSARTLLREKEQICRELSLPRELATCLGTLAGIYRRTGDPQRALGHYREAVSFQRDLGDEPGIAITLYNVGTLLRDELASPRESQPYLDGSLALAKKHRLMDLLRRLEG